MTYATELDIQNEFKDISFGNANDILDSSVISDFLAQTDAFIDMSIGQRYILPVVDSQALLILKKIEIDIVVCRIRKLIDLTKSSMYPSDNVPQENTKTQGSCDNNATLKAIKDGQLTLPNTDFANAGGGLTSFHAENTDIYPVFMKGVTQW